MFRLFIIFIVPLFASFVLTPLFIKFCRRYNIFDYPGEEKGCHKEPIPTMGGVVTIFSFYVTLWLTWILGWESGGTILNYYIGLTAAGFIILLIGIYDDIYGASVLKKFIFQIIVAFTLCYFGYGIEEITNPFNDSISLSFLKIPITMLWIIGIMNAINFIDGSDGLAAGVVIISSLSLLAVSYGHHEFMTILVTIILLGATIGFLKYNLPPAKIFLGDTGSMFLGLIMASVSLLENRKGTVTITLLLPIVIMGVPIIDTFAAIIRRIINKKSPFERDKEHIHHRLLKLGLSPKQVLLLIYSICIYLGFTAYILSVTPKQYHFVMIIILGMGLFIGVVIGVETLKFIERRSKRNI